METIFAIVRDQMGAPAPVWSVLPLYVFLWLYVVSRPSGRR